MKQVDTIFINYSDALIVCHLFQSVYGIVY